MVRSGVVNRKLHIVLELCQTDLAKYQASRGGILSESLAHSLFVQLAEGVKYIHYRGYVHRDLKPENILLYVDDCQNTVLKVCDFNLSRKNIDDQTGDEIVLHSGKGTPYYCSPEMLLSKGYTHKSDIWSVGCILLDMTTGRSPFYFAQTLKELKVLCSGDGPVQLWEDFEIQEQTQEILQGILTRNPRKRWGWFEIFHSEYFQNQPFLESDLVNHHFSM